LGYQALLKSINDMRATLVDENGVGEKGLEEKSRRRTSSKRIAAQIIAVCSLVLSLALLFPFAWQSWVNWRYEDRLYTVETVPQRQVAIVFGARVYGTTYLSAMLRDRVDTAVELYHAGKVEKLLLTGDNSTADYNEPGAMMAHAIAKGVDPADIQPDYGGRRTYDSCYRAGHVFQVTDAVLVTQAFHLPRALLLCSSLGLDSVGVSADRRQYDPRSIAWSEMREVPALLVALTDLVRQTPPPVLGDPIPFD
jgi:SanA protein